MINTHNIDRDFDEMIRKDHEALTKQIEYEKKFDPEIVN
jgi:hypothetical protein